MALACLNLKETKYVKPKKQGSPKVKVKESEQPRRKLLDRANKVALK